GTARLWDPITGELLQILSVDMHTVWCVDFSPDGTKAFTGGSALLPYYAGAAKLWDLTTGEAVQSFSRSSFAPHSVLQEGHVLSADFSPDGKRLLTGSTDGLIVRWDIASGRLQDRYDSPNRSHRSAVKSIAFSPDGKLALTADADDTASLWDISDGTLLSTLPVRCRLLWCVAFSSDGMLAATGGSSEQAFYEGEIKVWSVNGLDLLRTFWISGPAAAELPGIVLSIAFSPDRKYVLSGHGDGEALLWDIGDIAKDRKQGDR
ncbi:MAG: WD40 repeat domain-containing protein, partial [bacterium]